MTEISEKKLAIVFGVSTELLSFIPELLDDLWELGGSSRLITDILKPLDLPADSTCVLDLACGKGAVAVTIARELGFRVTGVDIFPPFIEEAKKRADEMGVDGLCQFKVADAQKVVSETEDYNIVILASAMSVFGTLDRCVASMRKCIQPGGYMVIDSGFLKDKSGGYGMYVIHDTSLRRLQQHGDKLISEILRTDEDIRYVCDNYLNALRSKADKITKSRPDVAEELSRYIKAQEDASDAMVKRTTGAVWLLHKVGH